MDVLSIDFGTSSTVGVLSAFGRGPRAIEVDGSVTMSSAVYVNDDGLLVVGQDAERRARLEPSRFEPNPKRRIDEGTLRLGDTDVDIADAFAAVLRRMGEEAERQLGHPPAQTRISHPAGWGADRQDVLRVAAAKARFADVRLIPEPVAAAAHYASLGRRAGGPIGVYDLGAGTFDCAVVGITRQGFTVLAEDGLSDLGSLDIDQALLVHIGRSVSHADPAQWQRLLRPQTTADRRTRRALLQDVRDAKESLSRHAQTHVPMAEPFGDVLVSRDELEALVRPSLLRSAELLAATIRRAGLTPAQLAGVYLVGGPSRMPLLATLLGRQLGVAPTTQDQPETAVAFGLHHVPLGTTTDLTVPAFAPVRPPVTPPRPQPWQQQIPRPPQHPPPPEPRRKPKRWFLALAVLLVAAVVATVVVFVIRDQAAQAAADCTQTAQRDRAGFTPCLRTLAGSVPDRSTCKQNDHFAQLLGGQLSVVCDFTGGSVRYLQGMTTEYIEVNTKLTPAGSAVRRGTWDGGGLHGEYVATADKKSSIVLFGVEERRVAAIYLTEDPSRLDDLIAGFIREVKPA
ncbi:molecular chaperone Hsp70 [Amycolatopsis mediterranei S699]|uniref:Molecular chaperone Hsp70 n=3 Tax=Amycolatopsis mediterranei TaxID=33910 RepID=A0A0H3DHR0_AMYMU|nr:Hsp70 family protein [Amycolatopsis mediterranei]ADJ50420.1 molecular chaperone Hsp70 [Amycolatopsis mediterranei U32]AEK47421.1 molecular chaperone Hsp70 [Amycolatopsis mediterranei S699]AFO82126.1 molecular chaperone Hsp70 [Amycolatopsis mediterranei S699]AGT89255.1 molecular chaperone Hsp70 [Amycolatopsis mediterranei RB]KDO08194.1 molecular chaperone Hsp70 [Amycolatopsis mediterranei]